MTATSSVTVRLVSGDEVTIPAALLNGDGDSEPRFVGMSVDGYVVVEAYGMRYGVTACCGASAKGSMTGDDEPVIVCRACYAEVDEMLGAPMDVPAENRWQPDEDPIDPESLGLVLDAALVEVGRRRTIAAELRASGLTERADQWQAKASRLAEAIGNLRQIG